MNGWISVSRDIQNHWLWKEKRKYSKFEAWISILLKANYKDTDLIIGKQKVELKRGSFLTSELKFCEEWRWSRDTVRKFLKQLEEEKMITVKHTTKYTIVSIDNWDLYQNMQQQNIQKGYNKSDNKFSKHYTMQEAMDWAKNLFRYTTKPISSIQQIVHRITIYILI